MTGWSKWIRGVGNVDNKLTENLISTGASCEGAGGPSPPRKKKKKKEKKKNERKKREKRKKEGNYE